MLLHLICNVGLHSVPMYEKWCRILTNPVSIILSLFAYRKQILFCNSPTFFIITEKNFIEKIGNTDNFLYLASKRSQLVPSYSCTYLIYKTGNLVYIFHCWVKSSESTTIIFCASSSPFVLCVRYTLSVFILPFLRNFAHPSWLDSIPDYSSLS